MPARKLRWRPNREKISETEALWQYILDHTRPHEKIGYVATIGFKDKDSFERSVRARAMGKYRYTLQDVDRQNKIKGKERKKGLKAFIKRNIQKLLQKW